MAFLGASFRFWVVCPPNHEPHMLGVAGGEERRFRRNGLFVAPRNGSGEEGKGDRMERFLAREDFSLGNIAHVPHG